MTLASLTHEFVPRFLWKLFFARIQGSQRVSLAGIQILPTSMHQLCPLSVIQISGGFYVASTVNSLCTLLFRTALFTFRGQLSSQYTRPKLVSFYARFATISLPIVEVRNQMLLFQYSFQFASYKAHHLPVFRTSLLPLRSSLSISVMNI